MASPIAKPDFRIVHYDKYEFDAVPDNQCDVNNEECDFGSYFQEFLRGMPCAPTEQEVLEVIAIYIEEHEEELDSIAEFDRTLARCLDVADALLHDHGMRG